MKVRFLGIGFFVASMLLVAAPVLLAQDGTQGAFAQADRAAFLGQRLNQLSGPTLAIADLDGDNKLDGAVVLKTGPFLTPGSFQIDLHFTGRDNANIAFQSSESDITVVALDIDHDGDIDLVIEQPLTRKRLQLWINDGHGNFEEGRTEDFPSGMAPNRDGIESSEHLDTPAMSLPTQRTFETMLMACHVAGRPPSVSNFAPSSISLFRPDPAPSLTHSRAPPLS